MKKLITIAALMVLATTAFVSAKSNNCNKSKGCAKGEQNISALLGEYIVAYGAGDKETMGNIESNIQKCVRGKQKSGKQGDIRMAKKQQHREKMEALVQEMSEEDRVKVESLHEEMKEARQQKDHEVMQGLREEIHEVVGKYRDEDQMPGFGKKSKSCGKSCPQELGNRKGKFDELLSSMSEENQAKAKSLYQEIRQARENGDFEAATKLRSQMKELVGNCDGKGEMSQFGKGFKDGKKSRGQGLKGRKAGLEKLSEKMTEEDRAKFEALRNEIHQLVSKYKTEKQ